MSEVPMRMRHRLAVWRSALVGVYVQIDSKNLGLIAAGVGFFAMLALFPALAALIALWGLMADPSVISAQLTLVQQFTPPDVYDLIENQITSIIAARNDTLGWTGVLSLLIALWLARAGVSALMQGLNAIYNERNRGGVRHYFLAFVLTVVLVGIALVALVAIVVTPLVLAFVPLTPFTVWFFGVLRWIVAVLVVLFGLGLLYRYGPNRRAARLPWITPGAIMAVMLWAAVSWGFTLYVANFNTYNATYGSIGAVIAMLIWLYLTAFLVLLGATLNAEIELRTKKDSTVGTDRPLGSRGAFVADRYLNVRRNR